MIIIFLILLNSFLLLFLVITLIFDGLCLFHLILSVTKNRLILSKLPLPIHSIIPLSKLPLLIHKYLLSLLNLFISLLFRFPFPCVSLFTLRFPEKGNFKLVLFHLQEKLNHVRIHHIVNSNLQYFSS